MSFFSNFDKNKKKLYICTVLYMKPSFIFETTSSEVVI